MCHTKAMTTLVEYGTRCLYEDTNFFSVLIVRSASWLKLKCSHFRKCCEENFYLRVRLMQNHMEIFSTAECKKHSHPIQARRQDLAAGGAKNQMEGPKTRRGGHIFKIQHWIYAATGRPNVKWGGTNFKWGGRAPLAPRWRRPWPHYWHMGGKNLKYVNHYKYLGAVLDSELSDDKDIQRQLR